MSAGDEVTSLVVREYRENSPDDPRSRFSAGMSRGGTVRKKDGSETPPAH